MKGRLSRFKDWWWKIKWIEYYEPIILHSILGLPFLLYGMLSGSEICLFLGLNASPIFIYNFLNPKLLPMCLVLHPIALTSIGEDE